MTKESVKKFIKDHKKEIITGTLMTIGGAILAISGVKLSKSIPLDRIIVCDEDFVKFLETYDESSNGCTQYFKLTLPEVAAAIDKNGIVRDCLRDQDGNLFEVKNLIAFGNKVEP